MNRGCRLAVVLLLWCTVPVAGLAQRPAGEGGARVEPAAKAATKGEATAATAGAELEPMQFSCDRKTRTCTCRETSVGDCQLMKSIACRSNYGCKGFTCTCSTRLR